MVITEKMVDV